MKVYRAPLINWVYHDGPLYLLLITALMCGPSVINPIWELEVSFTNQGSRDLFYHPNHHLLINPAYIHVMIRAR